MLYVASEIHNGSSSTDSLGLLGSSRCSDLSFTGEGITPNIDLDNWTPRNITGFVDSKQSLG